MAEADYWRTPFDPPDPYPEDTAARQRMSRITQDQDPRLRIPGSFAALRVTDRSGPGYAGSFMDAGEWPYTRGHEIAGSSFNTPPPTGEYRGAVTPRPEDLRNPQSVDLGIRSIKSPQEMVIAKILSLMEAKKQLREKK